MLLMVLAYLRNIAEQILFLLLLLAHVVLLNPRTDERRVIFEEYKFPL